VLQKRAMEKLTINSNIKVFGINVKTFPAGIGAAFDELISKTGDAAGTRNYYGISYLNNNGEVIYKAVAAEKIEGEAEKYGYADSEIEKGEYLCKTLKNWQTQTDCIKDLFHEMMEDKNADRTKPCIEWYKSDDEMLCLVRSK
jgi:predicted transcriptional regulator YdeE